MTAKKKTQTQAETPAAPSADQIAAAVRAAVQEATKGLCATPIDTEGGACQLTDVSNHGNYATVEGQAAEGPVQVTVAVRWAIKAT